MHATEWKLCAFVTLALLAAGCGSGGGAQPTAVPDEQEAPVMAEADAAPMIEIPNARTPLPGILTGGQPTPEQLEQAAAEGYRTIINLRGNDEAEDDWEGEKVIGLGMFYTQIPVGGADDLTPQLAQSLADALYAPDALPAMVHCASGNRVGAMLALKAAWVDGVPGDEALALGEAAGLTRLHDRVAELLEVEADSD